ncbi:MAG: CDP-alcohol phosphatidyltransferase family protein [bacterium]|nr:CDP-alcohol phosphatidyltransferase family protein [bacterium]
MIETETEAPPRDFQRLRQEGRHRGIGLTIGMGFVHTRELFIRGLAAVGITANMVTATGFAVAVAAGVCLVFGAGHVLPRAGVAPGPTSWWPLGAAIFMTLIGSMDILDGALARLQNKPSRFGEMLDSFLDRCGDLAVCSGCALHFALVGNVTFAALAIVGMCNATLISYVKARAENLIDDCGVGYWLRGERMAAFVIAAYAGHVSAAVLLLAVSPAFTVLRRLRYVYAVMAGRPETGPQTGVQRWLRPWREPRGSVAYDVVTGTNIAFLLFGPWVWPFAYGQSDPLGMLLRNWAS